MGLTAKRGWIQRWIKILKLIRSVDSEAELEQVLVQLGTPGEAKVLAFVNAHAMNCVAASEAFGLALLSADLIVRDGSGMAILLKILERPAGLNLNGTDLIPRIIRNYDGKQIALLGTQEPFLSRGLEKIKTDLAPSSVISALDGFRFPQEYLDYVLLHKPDLIVLGMGMPKQEQVAALLKERVHYPCLIVCGGAIIDFLGGKIPRAPQWMRSMGIEWVFRLAQEPRRLFERYVLGNPLFLLRSLCFRRRGRRVAPPLGGQ
jgi:N-acetylglucosaminyldiphosphoundecaprenol N-acetyl-beta-D-mannosaminyltransferase